MDIKKEAEYFGDIIIVPYMDHYDLVVLKTVAICEYGVSDGGGEECSWFVFFCFSYDFPPPSCYCCFFNINRGACRFVQLLLSIL